MQFTRLRLSGFKSFVEPTEFLINPGLTGVVGPNGCGKSNLVEALRWVMGENSPKKMRGSAMDDVIFAGTTTRAARNLAEVTLHLDNSSRRAPVGFNDAEELEIVRRIERESGSNYRINGRDVRARDVQLLFADLATGAHSTALVSQGRIGALINAKPQERRALLEEAAGIAGLHSRRHEAELRLKAAETNLERVSDVLAQLEVQLGNLKRQARQSSRYRNLQEQIRKNEALLFHLRYKAAETAQAEAEARLNESTMAVAQLTEAASSATVAEANAAEAVPGPRMAEAEASARLHRLTVARDGIDAEERRAIEKLEEIGYRINQAEADLAREKALHRDSAEALERLDAEAEEIAIARDDEAAEQATVEDLVAERQQAAETAQAELDALTRRAAEEGAERQRLSRLVADTEDRVSRLRARLAELETEIAALGGAADGAGAEALGEEIERLSLAAEEARVMLDEVEGETRDAVQEADAAARTLIETAEAEGRAALAAAEGAARAAVQSAEREAAATTEQAEARSRERIEAADADAAATIELAELQGQEALEGAEEARIAAESRLQEAREAMNAGVAEVTRLAAEEAGLAKLLATKDGDLWPPLIDAVTVTPGFEHALGAALGDDLTAGSDEAAPTHWDQLPPLDNAPALPAGVEPLSAYVTGPAALARRLGQIGVVEDADGPRLRASLAQGQRLVSRSGALWRWDGYTMAAGAPTAAAARLEQRNRLAELREELARARAARETAEAAYRATAGATETARAAEAEARHAAQGLLAQARQAAQTARDAARREAQAALDEARHTARQLLEETRAHAQATVDDTRGRTQSQQAEARNRAQSMQTEARGAAEAALGRRRDALRLAESALGQARDHHANVVREAAARASRLEALNQAAGQARRDLDEAEARFNADREALDRLPHPEEVAGLLAAQRPKLEQQRQLLAEARGMLETLRREAMNRARRAEAIVIERRSWANRSDNAERQIRELEQRRALAHAERTDNAALPAELARKRETLAESIATAEAERSAAARTLAEAEETLARCQREARQTAEALSTARELRARRESDATHAAEVLSELVGRIREALDVAPEETYAMAEIEPDQALPEIPAVEQRLDRLKRERDGMGPVNLRADIEAQEVEEQFTTLTTEKEDLIAAIDRLRQGISSLNKEGRERLLDAFKQVDRHFQELFTKVFGGGSAHLQLVESDDPLEAGLEIMASPPGKKLQVMSLLSGGEQALTALSLLFAVFRTNPSPICVLDEVDAPLDDANVERMCDLLDEMAKAGDTRYLVVTHHPVTMARMDRLFGVTMAERGVSHLVSVDLAGAAALKAIA